MRDICNGPLSKAIILFFFCSFMTFGCFDLKKKKKLITYPMSTYLILTSALLASDLHGFFVSTFILALVRIPNETFEMAFLHTFASFRNCF